MKKILLILLVLFTLIPVSAYANTGSDIRTSVQHYSDSDYKGIDIDEIRHHANNIDGAKAYSKVKDLSIYMYVVLVLIGLLLLMFGKVKIFVAWLVLGAISVLAIHNVEGVIGAMLSLGESFFDFLVSD